MKKWYAQFIIGLCFYLLKTVGITVIDFEDVGDDYES